MCFFSVKISDHVNCNQERRRNSTDSWCTTQTSTKNLPTSRNRLSPLFLLDHITRYNGPSKSLIHSTLTQCPLNPDQMLSPKQQKHVYNLNTPQTTSLFPYLSATRYFFLAQLSPSPLSHPFATIHKQTYRLESLHQQQKPKSKLLHYCTQIFSFIIQQSKRIEAYNLHIIVQITFTN